MWGTIIDVIFVGIIVLHAFSNSEGNSNRLTIAVVLISALLFVMIIFLNGRMSAANVEWNNKQQEALLEQVDQLPVLQLSDFGDSSEPQQAVQTNSSVLGDNLLYAEKSESGYIFTNYTTMRSPALAEPIFDYLYQQAQVDFNATFEIDSSLGTELYLLKDAHSGLFQKESTVCLFTVPEGTDLLAAAQILLDKGTHTLP